MTEEQAQALLDKMDQLNNQVSSYSAYDFWQGMTAIRNTEGALESARQQVVEVGSVSCGLLLALVFVLGMDRLLPR